MAADHSTAATTDDWREAMTQIAHRSYDAFQRHPWTFDLVALVDDYVIGHAMRARESVEQPPERVEALVAYIDDLLATGEFPRLAAWAGGDTRRGIERVAETAADPDRFERGLQTLLDGIELRLRARQ